MNKFIVHSFVQARTGKIVVKLYHISPNMLKNILNRVGPACMYPSLIAIVMGIKRIIAISTNELNLGLIIQV